MKDKKTMYINCDEHMFSKNFVFAVLLMCIVVSGISFLLSTFKIITALDANIILSVCAVFAVICLYRLSKEPSHNYIFINNEEISFKQNKLDKETRLRFEGIAYFETHFSKIVFSTTDKEKVVLQLNKIANKQKRWEIKEFLRTHLKQQPKTNFKIRTLSA